MSMALLLGPQGERIGASLFEDHLRYGNLIGSAVFLPTVEPLILTREGRGRKRGEEKREKDTREGKERGSVRNVIEQTEGSCTC